MPTPLLYLRNGRSRIYGWVAPDQQLGLARGMACAVLKPLPGLRVIRDLFVDTTGFFKQYHSIKSWLVNDEPPPERERLQSREARDELNGLYECILCACCSSACPSFWWNSDKYVGPARLLQAYRFVVDSHDQAGGERLDDLQDPYRHAHE